METYHLLPATLNLSTKLNDESNEVPHDHSFFELFYIKSGSIGHLASNMTERLSVGDAYLISPAFRTVSYAKKAAANTATCLFAPFYSKPPAILSTKIYTTISWSVK